MTGTPPVSERNTQVATYANITHIQGDLFESNTSLCHCVSSDLSFGKGIAKSFRDRYGGEDQLQEQPHQIGDTPYLERDGIVIFYLVTKKLYHQKPTYDSIEKSLETMRDIMIQKHIHDISMPRIGCGLDKKNWTEIEKILGRVFKDTDIKISVYSL
ncbi:unnamed protein product [marine sediment metagenome]|uniref:Macro domain-containing protein n=1 Tax=marine sediment metagenome TaxID=412755 RepID=X1D507_9ZZZZ